MSSTTTSSGGAEEGKEDVVVDHDSTVVFAKSLVAHFTKRDLVLYALGIGCCGGGDDIHDIDDIDRDRDRELRYVYEGHPEFEAFPSFLLSLPFVASARRRNGRNSGAGRDDDDDDAPIAFGIRPFPPEFMSNYLEDGRVSNNCGLLPRRFFRNNNDAGVDGKYARDMPILHVSQDLQITDGGGMESFVVVGHDNDDDVDPPMSMRIETRISSVEPRKIGTFVTSVTTYHHHHHHHSRRRRRGEKCIATSRMVALILGLDPDAVIPYREPTSREDKVILIDVPSMGKNGVRDEGSIDGTTTTVVRYRIPNNAALLYRLSGDYNPIHVEDNLPGSAGATRSYGPVLHGLCTLGYSLRAVMSHVHRTTRRRRMKRRRERESDAWRLMSVRCDFVRPVHVNDVLRVEVWDDGEECPSAGSGPALDVCFRVFRERRRGERCGEDSVDIDKQCGDVVVDKGRAQFCLKRSRSDDVGAVSRL